MQSKQIVTDQSQYNPHVSAISSSAVPCMHCLNAQGWVSEEVSVLLNILAAIFPLLLLSSLPHVPCSTGHAMTVKNLCPQKLVCLTLPSVFCDFLSFSENDYQKTNSLTSACCRILSLTIKLHQSLALTEITVQR